MGLFDKLIKDASALICECFTHGAVFRIGGDEFVVILQEKGFDTSAAMAYFAGDEDFYSEMLAEYVKEFNDREPKLSGFLNDCDWKEYQILVHSLKSASKSIGATELYDKALALENAAKEEDGGFIKENHPGTMELYRKVVETISECEKH